jgi:hypothetical protein
MPEPHDFSVRDHITRPRQDCALTSPRPSHPALNVRDDREARVQDGGKQTHNSEKRNRNIFAGRTGIS